MVRCGAIVSQARLVDTVRVLRQVSSKGDRQLTLTLGKPGVSGLIPTARHSAQLVSRCQCLVVFAKCVGNLFMSAAIGGRARLGDDVVIGCDGAMV